MEGFTPRDTDILPDPIMDLTALVAATTAPTLATEGYAVKDDLTIMGCRFINVLARLSGLSAAAMNAYPYWYNDAAETWFPAACILISTDAEVLANTDGTKGNVYKMEVPEGCSRFLLHFPAGAALAADNICSVTITKGT